MIKFFKRLNLMNIYLGLTAVGFVTTWLLLCLVYVLRWQKPVSIERFCEIIPSDWDDMCFGTGIIVVFGLPTLIINLCME